MAKVILSPEMQMLNKVQPLYDKQRNKKFNYTLDDFEIYDSQWKHKDWKTWCKGAGRYDKTKEIVEKYIVECNKPLEERDFSFVHLIDEK